MRIVLSVTIERLKAWGCDTDGALRRMLGDEEFYISCIEQTAGDPAFGELERALREHDIKTAFDAAHTLKGVLANMGLTPMYDIIVRIVEPLRAGSDEGTAETYARLAEKLGELKTMIAD